MNKNPIVNIINLHLQHKNLSWYRLSKLTGIPESSLTDLRNGRKKEITLSAAAKIAKALDITIDQLYYGIFK